MAAAASAGAGLVHAGAAGSHEGAGSLALLFGLTAAAQVAWAAAAIEWPRRATLLAGLAINGGAVTAWWLSRSTGLPIIDALAEPEAIGTQDLVAASLGALAVAGALLAMVRPASAVAPAPGWVALVSLGTLVLAVPALAADHTHGPGPGPGHGDGQLAAAHTHGESAADDSEHAHEDGGGQHGMAGSETAAHAHAGVGDPADDHGHTPSGTSGDGHGHTAVPGDDHSHGGSPSDLPHDPGHPHPPGAPPAGPPHDPGDPGHPHPPGDPPPTGPIISIDDPRLTPGQQAAARSVLDRTRAAMRAFPTVAAVQAAGYETIGDGGTGYEHFVNWSYLQDGRAGRPGGHRVDRGQGEPGPDQDGGVGDVRARAG